MSTALVSSFYDMGDVLWQQNRSQKNYGPRTPTSSWDGRAVGSPVPIRNRHSISSSISSSGSTSPSFSIGNSPPPNMPNNPLYHNSNLISVSEYNLLNLNNRIISSSVSGNPPTGGVTNSTSTSVSTMVPGGLAPPPMGSNVGGVYRKLDRSVSEPADRNSNMNNGLHHKNSNINSTRYKTELCRPFEENGYCKYGDKCQFAHGSNEQRSLSRHPKYKTEFCRTFHTIGFCPYGPRCHFIHNEDELKLHQITHLKQQQAAVQAAQQSQLQAALQAAAQQVPVPGRPKGLGFGSMLPPLVTRESLGSAGESPASSVTDSPTTLSPTSFTEELMSSNMMRVAFSPPNTAPPTLGGVFNFHDLPPSTGICANPTPSPLMTPLNVQTDPIASLAAGLQAASINSRNNNNINLEALQDCLRDVFYTPSASSESPNSDIVANNTCMSPLEISRNFRLPIFSQLATQD